MQLTTTTATWRVRRQAKIWIIRLEETVEKFLIAKIDYYFFAFFCAALHSLIRFLTLKLIRSSKKEGYIWWWKLESRGKMRFRNLEFKKLRILMSHEVVVCACRARRNSQVSRMLRKHVREDMTKTKSFEKVQIVSRAWEKWWYGRVCCCCLRYRYEMMTHLSHCVSGLWFLRSFKFHKCCDFWLCLEFQKKLTLSELLRFWFWSHYNSTHTGILVSFFAQLQK